MDASDYFLTHDPAFAPVYARYAAAVREYEREMSTRHHYLSTLIDDQLATVDKMLAALPPAKPDHS